MLPNRFWTFIIWARIMNTRNHRNLCKGIEKVAGFTSSGQGGERFLCDRSNGRFADLQMAMLVWQTLINFLCDWSDNRFAGLQMAMLVVWQTLINFLSNWSDNRFADLQMAMLAWQTLINLKMWRNSFSGGILTRSAFKISSVPATCSVRWLSESKRLRFLLLEMTVGYGTIEESWN